MDIRPIGPGSTGSSTPAAPAAAPAAGLQNTAAAPAVPGSLVQQPAAIPDTNQVKQAVDDINAAMKTMSNKIEFTINEDSKEPVVKVIDAETGDLIRQIPTEEALEISKALDRVQGLLVRQQA